MAEPLKHQPFMALNANNNVRRIHPGVVKRDAKDAPLSSKRIREIMSSKERAEREPDRSLVDVSQPREAPLPVDPPAPEVADMPRKKSTRSPESIAKQKATLARKKRKKARATKGGNGATSTGDKKAFVLANPGTPAPELVRMAKKQGISMTTSHVYNVRSQAKNGASEEPIRAARQQRGGNGPVSNGGSIGDLLRTIKESTAEIERRLSQLTL